VRVNHGGRGGAFGGSVRERSGIFLRRWWWCVGGWANTKRKM